jgi:hypothetical protein
VLSILQQDASVNDAYAATAGRPLGRRGPAEGPRRFSGKLDAIAVAPLVQLPSRTTLWRLVSAQKSLGEVSQALEIASTGARRRKRPSPFDGESSSQEAWFKKTD